MVELIFIIGFVSLVSVILAVKNLGVAILSIGFIFGSGIIIAIQGFQSYIVSVTTLIIISTVIYIFSKN